MAKIRIMALGGLDEAGKNCYVIEIDGDIFIIDAGLKYPSESEQLGVEFVVCDYSYLVNNKDKVKALLISHGHDDVMGGVFKLVEQIDVPIYATALTAKIIEDNLNKFKIKNKSINVIEREATFVVSGHTIHSFPVMQSIADGVGYSIETENGQIVYTSEFIFDYDFISSHFGMDVNVFSQMGKEKVLALLCESKGASRTGYTSPKHKISEHIEHYFEINCNRLIITLYDQNLFRLLEIIELAVQYHKKLFFYEDDYLKILKWIETLGYYKLPKDILLTAKDFNNDLKDVVIIVSGSGGNVFKIMNNIAIGENSLITLSSTDTVIIASPIAPGTEKYATAMENDLYRADVNIVKLSPKEVLTMHASIEDLKMMLYLIKPKYYIPIKGSYSELINNADLAVSIGYTPDKIIILDNGQFATIDQGRLVSTSELIEVNESSIDSSSNSDVSGMILKDRASLSTDGVIVCGIVLDYQSKKVIGGPDIQSRGVIYLKDADNILNEIGNILQDTIKEKVADKTYENMSCRVEAKDRISRFVLKETGKKPMILPAIVEINVK